MSSSKAFANKLSRKKKRKEKLFLVRVGVVSGGTEYFDTYRAKSVGSACSMATEKYPSGSRVTYAHEVRES